MAQINPFNAVRPYKSFVNKIASPPYDIVTLSEAKKIIKTNPYSFLRVTRADAEFESSQNPYEKTIYLKAKENYSKFISNNWMFKDTKETFFIYEIKDKNHIQTGITGLFSCNDYKNNIIKKHENTRLIKEDDRTQHIKITSAQTGQVYLMHERNNFCKKTIQKSCVTKNLLYDFSDDENVNHKVWQVPPELIKEIQDEISELEKIYIVDGHHRAAAAVNNNCKFFVATIFPHNQLSTGCCNRVVNDISPLINENLLDRISEYFITTKIDKPELEQFAVYWNKSWYSLNLKEKTTNSTLEKLDSYILQKYILEKILKITNPRLSKKINYFRNTKGIKFLEDCVNNNEFSAAFNLAPPSIEDIIAVADEENIMPPKSTWFLPKLKDGLLIYECK